MTLRTATYDTATHKLVPLEPTEEMIYELACGIDNSSSTDDIANAFRNAISSAPEYKESEG
jgi:hypothetical protein